MRGSIIALATIAIMAFTTLASESNVMSDEQLTNELSYSPQVCQFSLSRYTGTISQYGNTDGFQVGLSCPQTTDVRATVVVLIKKEIVASKIVTIKAGKEYSDNISINVGQNYSGQQYNLIVE